MKLTAHMVPLYHLELVREKDIPYRSVSSKEAAAEVFHEMLDSSPVEKLAVIYVNSSGKMIGAEYIAIGGLEMVQASMSEIFRGAIKANAPGIWLAHNHVDGNVIPSLPDYRFTLAAVDSATLLQINLIDHLVVGPGAYWSIKDHQDEMTSVLLSNKGPDLIQGLKKLLSIHHQ